MIDYVCTSLSVFCSALLACRVLFKPCLLFYLVGIQFTASQLLTAKVNNL